MTSYRQYSLQTQFSEAAGIIRNLPLLATVFIDNALRCLLIKRY